MNSTQIGLIVAGLVLLFVLVTLARTIRIVPQARAGVVERLGRYQRTLNPGLAILVPFVDRLLPLLDLREQVVSFPPQPVITEDNLVVNIDSVIYFQVTDPRSARICFSIESLMDAGGSMALSSTRLTRTPHLPVASSRTPRSWALIASRDVSVPSRSIPPTTLRSVVTVSRSIASTGFAIS